MSQHCVQCSGVQGCGPTWDRAWAQGVLPPRVFAWLWQARVRAMLRRRERHVCKLQTVSAVMARPRPRRPMLTPLGRPEPSETWTGLHGMPGHTSGVIVVSARTASPGGKLRYCMGLCAVRKLVVVTGLLRVCTDMVLHGWSSACVAAPPGAAALPARLPSC